MAQQILKTHKNDVANLQLIPGTDGVFDITADNKLIFSRNEEGGRYPTFEEINALL